MKCGKAIRTNGQRVEGFTLIEVMVAMAILFTGVLGVALMQNSARKQGGAALNTFDATAIAQSQFAHIDRLRWEELIDTGGANVDAPVFEAIDYTGATPTVTQSLDAKVDLKRDYTVEWAVTTVDDTRPCVKEVQLRVRWNEAQFPKSLTMSTRRFNSVGNLDGKGGCS